MLRGVGVNYLPVNSAPVVDELVVVPGARLNPQNQANPQQQTVNITFPSANQGSAFDPSTANSNPLPAMKDKTAITVRWAAHDDNGDDLTFTLYLRGDNENVWRLLKDGVTEKAYTFDAIAASRWRLPGEGGGLRCAVAQPGRGAHQFKGERPVRGGYDAAGGHQPESGGRECAVCADALLQAGAGHV